MTIKLTRSDNGYAALGRFSVTREYRAARRGPTDQVADGWGVLDEETGTRWSSFTLGHVKGSIEAALETEERARQCIDEVVAWRGDISRQGNQVEIYLALEPDSDVRAVHTVTVDAVVYPLIRGGSVGGGDQEHSPVWVRRLLGIIGLPEDLQRF